MLRPADCRVCFALPRKISPTRPTVSGRSSPTCILSVSKTAKQHSVIPPTNQSVSSLSVWVQACWVVSLSVVAPYLSGACLNAQELPPCTEQPESTPRVSFPTAQYPPIVESLSWSCVGWFLNYTLIAYW